MTSTITPPTSISDYVLISLCLLLILASTSTNAASGPLFTAQWFPRFGSSHQSALLPQCTMGEMGLGMGMGMEMGMGDNYMLVKD